MVLRARSRRADHLPIDGSGIDGELERLNRAVRTVLADLERTERELRGAPQEHASVAMALITSHRAVLTDPLLVDGVRRQIRDRLRNAEWAIECVVDELRNTMFRLDNPGLRDWWRDVEALVDTLLGTLGGGSGRRGFPSGASVVAVAPTMGVGDAIELIEAGGAGLVLEHGSLTSHVAVLCRAAGLPAVVGVPDACSRVENGRTLLVDGDRGIATHDDEAASAHASRESGPSAAEPPGEPVATACGQRVVIRANLSLDLDAERARRHGVMGVGLMRTFYQFVGRARLPGEDHLHNVYAAVLAAFAPAPVNIRLLDLGGSFGDDELPAELRHLRDCRGIRLAQERPEIVRTQLRALCRAATAGHLRLLVPFVTDVEEISLVRRWITELREELEQLGVEVGTMEVGAMIEVPAAVMCIDAIAAVSDLLAIGTNDLAQYLLASPRDAPWSTAEVPHPAVLEAIAQVCAAGQRHGVPVSLCGEVASEPAATRALLECGLRELSVSPRLAPPLIRHIRSLDLAGA